MWLAVRRYVVDSEIGMIAKAMVLSRLLERWLRV